MAEVAGVFECPECGTEWIVGKPAKARPPICSLGHKPCEMEQKLERGEHRTTLAQIQKKGHG